jgi:sulfatase maturation enzyme AslB (radical SAM superfamily)
MTVVRIVLRKLKAISDASEYSFDVRISIDGYTSEVNDPIRGAGTFEKILVGIHNLAQAGLNPVVTVTEACGEAASAEGRAKFLDWMRSIESRLLDHATGQGHGALRRSRSHRRRAFRRLFHGFSIAIAVGDPCPRRHRGILPEFFRRG